MATINCHVEETFENELHHLIKLSLSFIKAVCF